MHLTQLRAAARNLTAPPPPSRTPTLVTPPKEGYLFHLEGQNLVAAFNRACVDGGCSPGERAALYERCVLRGGLREVVEAQEEKVRRGHERARGIVREERREVRPEVAGVGSVVHAWEGPADGRRADGVVRAGVADAAFERAMVDARYAAIVDSWVTTMTGPRDWPIANAVLDATITDVELDGSTVGVFFDLPMAGVAFDGATMAEVVVAEAPPPPPARVSRDPERWR
ncbi:hypothetical protein LTR29_005368 [Friedmanniomyces endolithicus]|nr:hypothetical protein LTR29_005368 [Friedmanniomyces endolithicus]